MDKIDQSLSEAILGFDPIELSRRYVKEREKRIRTDAEAQYLQISNDSPFSNKYLEDDPYSEQLERAPLKEQREIILVGGGWVGLLTAARLIEAGVRDIRIIESGSDFGGTWYWNRYPGAQCDIESYSYLPLLEETGYIPKLRFSYASEIYEHAQRIGKHFDLYKDAIFQTWVTELRWLEGESMWVIQYRISDPKKFLFEVREPSGTLRYVSESVMREVVGDRTVDEVITIGRQEIESEALIKMQGLSTKYAMGISIDQVQLKNINPPKPVQESFNEVNQAQQEKEKLINEARRDYNKVIPLAEGEKDQRIREADGYRLKRINEAEGDAARFTALLAEYTKAPEVTRRRIYIETLQDVMPGIRSKIVIDEQSRSILPLLNLPGTKGTQP